METYDDGYVVGFEEGRYRGYEDGYSDAVTDYEQRLAKYWAELATLNARISYLERIIGME